MTKFRTMKFNKSITTFVVVMFAISVMATMGIGLVGAESSTLPNTQDNIGNDATTINYTVDSIADYSNLSDGTVTSSDTVNVTVTVTGVNNSTNTQVYTNTIQVGQNTTTENSINITETQRNNYDSFSASIVVDSSTESGYINTTSFTVDTVSGGGALIGEESALSFLNDPIAGIPLLYWLALVAIGALVYYNDNEGF